MCNNTTPKVVGKIDLSAFDKPQRGISKCTCSECKDLFDRSQMDYVTQEDNNGNVIQRRLVCNWCIQEMFSVSVDTEAESGCPVCGSYEGNWQECPECGQGQ